MIKRIRIFLFDLTAALYTLERYEFQQATDKLDRIRDKLKALGTTP